MKIAIRKAQKEVEVDFAKLPAASQEYIIAYGLTQCLNDAHASVTDGDADEVMKKVAERVKRLEAGNPPAVGQRGDELTTETRAILVNLLRRTNMKTVDAKAASKDIDAGVKLLLTRKKLPADKAAIERAMATIVEQAAHVIEMRNITL